MDLHIGAILGSQSHCSVQHKLHVSSSRGFFGSQRNLLWDIAGRDQLLCFGHIIIFHHHNLQIRTYLGIIFHQLLQTKDQMDDILCNCISRRCLCPKDHSQRTFRQISFLDFFIFVNCIQRIHLLSLILVETFDLNVKHGILIHIQVLSQFQIFLQLKLCAFLDFSQIMKYHLVFFVVQKLLQHRGIFHILWSHQLFKIGCKLWITVHQPSTESDSVGLIGEFLRVNVIKRFQLRFLQNLCVQSRYTIYCISVVNVNMSHVHPILIINDKYLLIPEVSAHSFIQFADDRQQMGNHFFQVRDRPFLQSFCQNRMVRVSTGLSHHIDRRVHVEAFFLGKQTNQFRNHHRWMGIVDLDGHMFMEAIQIISFLLSLFQDELSRVAHHKILLINTQQLSALIAVIRIKEQS